VKGSEIKGAPLLPLTTFGITTPQLLNLDTENIVILKVLCSLVCVFHNNEFVVQWGLVQLILLATFMEPESSLPHSQESATCPYPEPAQSSPFPHITLPEDPSEYYPPINVWVS